MSLNVSVDSFGNDFLHQFASALKQADGAVGFGLAVVRVVWFV